MTTTPPKAGIFDLLLGSVNNGIISLAGRLKLKFASAGELQIRNQADNDYANLLVKTPANDDTANQVTTVEYVLSKVNGAGIPAGVLVETDVAVGTDATTDGGSPIASSKKVRKVVVNVTSAYDNNATLTVGFPGAGKSDVLVDSNDVMLSAPGIYAFDVDYTTLSSDPVRATIGSNPTVGSCEIYVTYQN